MGTTFHTRYWQPAHRPTVPRVIHSSLTCLLTIQVPGRYGVGEGSILIQSGVIISHVVIIIALIGLVLHIHNHALSSYTGAFHRSCSPPVTPCLSSYPVLYSPNTLYHSQRCCYLRSVYERLSIQNTMPFFGSHRWLLCSRFLARISTDHTKSYGETHPVQL